VSRTHRSVLITGASSGIGRGLARAYAAPGVRLALIGRDPARLEAVAVEARAKGAVVETGIVDVRDRAALAQWLLAADGRQPFDLAIANAGITTGLAPGELTEEPEAVRALIATNLFGVLNTVEPLIAPMCARRTGQVVMIGSIAGLHGLPYSPAYCVAKAGVHAYAESIRARLEQRGVLVSLVVAGFVKTPLNDAITAMKPGEISEDEAGLLIKRRVAAGHATIAFPWFLYLAARAGRWLPARLYDRLMRSVDAPVPPTRERV
jgi:short-subunit dehydrogenase